MTRAFATLIVALLAVPAPSRTQMVHGIVLEHGTSTPTPVPGALVELLTPDARRVSAVRTGKAGEFLLLSSRSGRYSLRITHLDYIPMDSGSVVLGRGEAVEIEIRLGRRIIPLEPLIVTARTDQGRAGFQARMRRPGFGKFIKRSEIEQRPAARATDLLQQMPGVYLVPVRPSGHLVYMRAGAGHCVPTVYVDGVVFRQTTPIDDFLTADMLEGVEVYTGLSAPSPIHSLTTCGVVAFWTRGFGGGGKLSWRKVAAGVGTFALAVILTRPLAR